MAVNVVLKSVWDDKGVKSALNEFQSFGKGVGVAFAAVAAATAAAATAIIKFGSDSIAAAENVAQANNRLEQVAKSMNLFGSQTSAVTQRIIEFAEANELSLAVDAEVIKQAQAKLLTFKNLAQSADETGGAFDRATMAAIDLAAAGFGSAETNATQLGKALQDPIKGLTALTRSGVTFTQEERNKIKVMVESGQVLEAQNMILSAIETQVGGTAAATAKASDKMKLAFDNISEAVGAALLPVFQEFSNELIKITPELEKALAPAAAEIADIFRTEVLPAIQDFTRWLASPEGTQTLRDLTIAIIDSIKALIDFIGWVVQNKDAIVLFTSVIAALVVTYKAVTIATGLFQAAMVLLQKQVVTTTATTTAFSAALRLLPFAAMVTGAVLLTSSLADYSQQVYGSRVNTEGMTKAQAQNAVQVESLRRLLGQYEYALESSTAANRDLAINGVAAVRAELARTELAIRTTVGELNRFNNMNLDRIKGEIRESAGELNRFNNLLKGIQGAPSVALPPINIPKPVAPTPATGGGGGGGGGGGSTTTTPRPFVDIPAGATAAAELINDATGILIDAFSDVDKVLAYLTSRIEAATQFANESAIRGETAAAMGALETRNLFRSQAELLRTQGANAVGTIININVKTDSTQSLAMVGKTLGNTITKYVSAGGQVLVSPTN
jgi:hypothetical protein